MCTFDEVISQNMQFSNFQNFICTYMSALLSWPVTTNFQNCQMNMTQVIGQKVAMSFQTI